MRGLTIFGWNAFTSPESIQEYHEVAACFWAKMLDGLVGDFILSCCFAASGCFRFNLFFVKSPSHSCSDAFILTNLLFLLLIFWSSFFVGSLAKLSANYSTFALSSTCAISFTSRISFLFWGGLWPSIDLMFLYTLQVSVILSRVFTYPFYLVFYSFSKSSDTFAHASAHKSLEKPMIDLYWFLSLMTSFIKGVN